MFKNLTVYRVSGAFLDSCNLLAADLGRIPFYPCGATQQLSLGWVPPREEHGLLVEAINEQWIACLAVETKSVPKSAIDRVIPGMAAAFEQQNGRRPGRREMRELREEAMAVLLPNAFPRTSRVYVWIDHKNGLLAVGSVSQKHTDLVCTALAAAVQSPVEIRHMATMRSPTAGMVNWLTNPYGVNEAGNEFVVGSNCELQSTQVEGRRLKLTNHRLDTDEVQKHIRDGELPVRLELEWRFRMAFTLTDTMQLRGIEITGDVMEADEDADRFDADVAIWTGELGPMIADLIAALGEEAEGAS